MTLAQDVICPSCKKPQKLTLVGKFRQHGPKDDPCEMSGAFLPGELLKPLPPEAPPCDDQPPTTRRNLAAVPEHAESATSTNDSTLGTPQEKSTEPPSNSAVPEPTSAAPGPVVTVEHKTDPIAPDLAARQLSAYAKKSGLYVEPEGVAGVPYKKANGFEACDFTCTADMDQCKGCESRHAAQAALGYDQPGPLPPEAPSKYDQPAKLNRAVVASRPMDPFELQLATMLKEIFYQYTNRSRRSQQTTLGPSQVGTPCDRRLVMHILGATHLNPGGDNWASFVGTQVHNGLEQMFKWADAGQGRFATEVRLQFPSALVPRGTADLIDRTLFMVDDHKAQGQWSADKLRTSGPGPLYRTQLHVYGMGARQRGERIERVALISWPRDKSNLDDLYVWSEPYDPQVARDALQRVDGLKAWSDKMRADGATPQQVAEAAGIADDCRFCPYHMPDAKDLSNGGCNGRV